MTITSRPSAVLIRQPAVRPDPNGTHFVLCEGTPSPRWSRVLSPRAARMLWDGLTTALFAAAGEKFLHVTQTALFKPEADPSVTDWVQVSVDPADLIVIRGTSTLAPNDASWLVQATRSDAQNLWHALEPLLFAEMRARARAAPAPAPAPAAGAPARHHVDVGAGIRLACDDHPGEDPPLLFVHGAYCDHTIWRYQVANFAPQRRCLVPDMRGHGDSTKPEGSYVAEVWAADLEQLLTSLDVRPPVVVGHSMGASAAMQLAATTRRPLAGLILIEPSVIVDDRETELFTHLSLGQEGTPEFGRRFIQRVDDLLGTEMDAQLTGALRRMMLATPPHVVAGLVEALLSFPTGATASRVRVPTLVLLAAHRYEDARFFRRCMPCAEVHLAQDVHHFPMLAAPARTNAALAEFISTLSESAPK